MNIFSFPDRKQTSTFEALVRPHLRYLYRLAYRFCGNQEDAEDLVQDLMVKMYPRVAELEPLANVRGWLVTSMYRMFVDGTRRKARSPLELVEDVSKLYDAVASDEPTPDQHLSKDQNQTQIQRAFRRLSEDHRVLLTLHDIEGYRLTELETMMDIPIGTLKSRIHRARARMRELLTVE